MKKVYAALCGLLMIGGAIAQTNTDIKPMAKEKTSIERSTSSTPIEYSGNRDVFYTNDFSDCADFTIETANEAGFTEFFDGLTFQCGTGLAPSGAAAIDAIESTSADNGFMMVDSDAAENQLEIENCWFQLAEPVDCSEHPFVSISFETQYFMWDGGASDGNEFCWVEVSTDGVTWPDVESTGEEAGRYELWPLMGTQDEVDNPTLITFEISDVAGGAEQVWLRFRWRGTFGYAWMVDDLQFFDTEANDIRAAGYASFTDEGTSNETGGLGYYEFHSIPQSQVTEMRFAATVENNGWAPQPNTQLEVFINGNSVGTSEPILLPYQGFDTLIVEGYTPPTDLGDYAVEYVISSDSTDFDASDNVMMQSFEVTEFDYARDDATFSGVFPADGTVEYVGAAPYQIFGDDEIHGIEVAFINSSEPNVDIIAHVYDFANFDIFASSEELVLLNPDVNGNDGDETGDDIMWYYFPLEDPFPVTAGEGWMVGFEHSGGADVQIGESRNVPDQTAFVYGPFGANQEFDWYFTNEVPMVRMIFEDRDINVQENAELNATLLQNMPNPATDVTTIAYELRAAAVVSYELRDLTGRLVQFETLGQQPAGANQFDVDVNELQAGIYTYSIIVNGQRFTQKMTVK
ncbi:MAG: T9SS type A sorting domain-containing protein [Flavobacteriales bacterium]|nr:T9SS type A sorting domain-containing protein [Flavobacteriales bacterium]